MRLRTSDRRANYGIGLPPLQSTGWLADPGAMLKLPSASKGMELGRLIKDRATKNGRTEDDLIARAHLAARIEHLVAIGGESMRPHFLNGCCILTPVQIAKLCRRMPPFIAVKLKDLATGKVKSDSNPARAFDTNGWPELRTRLPKCRSTLQHYARQPMKAKSNEALVTTKGEELRAILMEIQAECDRMLGAVVKFTPIGAGKPRAAKGAVERSLPWSHGRSEVLPSPWRASEMQSRYPFKTLETELDSHQS